MPCLEGCVHVKCVCDRHEEYTYYEDFVWVQYCHCDAALHDAGGFSLDYGDTYQINTRQPTPWTTEQVKAWTRILTQGAVL